MNIFHFKVHIQALQRDSHLQWRIRQGDKIGLKIPTIKITKVGTIPVTTTLTECV